MKHLFKFGLVLCLACLLLFAVFCFDFSFGKTYALKTDFCASHAVVSVKLVLPEAIKEASEALFTLPPPTLTEIPKQLFFSVGRLFQGMKEAALRDKRGCTALALPVIFTPPFS